MSPDFTIRKNDLEPQLNFQAQYQSGTAVDLTGATATMVMALEGAAVDKIRTSTGVTITDALNGKGNYAWQGTDTDTPGDYLVSIVITFPSGRAMTCPNLGFVRVQVTDNHE